MNEAPNILYGLLMTGAGQKVRGQYVGTGDFTDHVFAAYAAFLPTALFGMRSPEHVICYSKRIFGLRDRHTARGVRSGTGPQPATSP